MISSTSNTDRIIRTDLLAVAGQSGSRPATSRPDQFSSASTSGLKVALDQQPAIRPDVVERARILAADPDYPSRAVMQHVARQIIATPDLSESEA
jgi:hypothetical protein